MFVECNPEEDDDGIGKGTRHNNDEYIENL